MKKAIIIVGIIAAVIAAFAVFFALQATPGNVLNSVRAESLEIINGAVTVPEKYTVIDSDAFSGKGEFSAVVIKGETKIESMAFYGCPNLREVTLEKACDIGSMSFGECPSLKKVTVLSADGSCAEDAFDGHGGVTVYCREDSAALQVAKIKDLSYKIIE